MNTPIKHVRQTTFSQIRIGHSLVLKDGRHFVKRSHLVAQQVRAAGSLGDTFVFDYLDPVIEVANDHVAVNRHYYPLPVHPKGRILRTRA